MRAALRERFLRAAGELFDVLSEMGDEAERPAPPAERPIVDARSSPFKSRTRFFQACDRGLKWFWRGRQKVAFHDDCVEFMKATTRPAPKSRKRPAPPPANDTLAVTVSQQLDTVLERAGYGAGRKISAGGAR